MSATVAIPRMILPLRDPLVLDILAAWGVPYSWGGGLPRHGKTAWPDGPRGIAGGVGWDCSGFAQAVLVRLGLLPENAPDRTAAGLYDISAPVMPGAAKVGDLAFYGAVRISHVMVVLGPGVVIGAAGGGQQTNGDDPRAYVKLERLRYRSDFAGVRRMGPLPRPEVEPA